MASMCFRNSRGKLHVGFRSLVSHKDSCSAQFIVVDECCRGFLFAFSCCHTLHCLAWLDCLAPTNHYSTNHSVAQLMATWTHVHVYIPNSEKTDVKGYQLLYSPHLSSCSSTSFSAQILQQQQVLKSKYTTIHSFLRSNQGNTDTHPQSHNQVKRSYQYVRSRNAHGVVLNLIVSSCWQ